jgi:hypothetical protein
MNDLLTPTEAARILKVSPGTLAIWRCTKRYPLPYITLGGAIRYELQAIQKFLASRTTGEDGITPKCVRRRPGGPGKPVGGWPSEQRKKARRAS